MAKSVESSKKKEEKEEGPSYEERCASLAPIAHPLCPKKLTKKVLKVVKKSKGKALKRGVKEVVKGLRKGVKGVVIIAGDISPIDVISHIPVLCEDQGIPYVYVPSKEDLGCAGSTKRPTSVIMLTGTDAEGYEEMAKEVQEFAEKSFSISSK